MLRENAGVVRVVAGEIAIRPTPAIFERLRQIPVVDGAEWTYSSSKQGVDQPAVMIQTFAVWRTGAGRLNARPGDGEAVALLIQLACQHDVLRIQMVLIAGDVSGRASLYLADGMGESIPDRLAFAILIPRAFNLVCGCRRAPQKTIRKARLSDRRRRDGARHLVLRRVSSRESIATEQCRSSCGYGIHDKLAAVHAPPFDTAQAYYPLSQEANVCLRPRRPACVLHLDARMPPM